MRVLFVGILVFGLGVPVFGVLLLRIHLEQSFGKQPVREQQKQIFGLRTLGKQQYPVH